MSSATDLAFSTPRYGFNFQWMVWWEEGRIPAPADERALDFMAKHGFNFVRIPTDYRFWTPNHQYLHPEEEVFEHVDRYLEATRQRNMHLSFNIHRAPGYCINSNHLERHNLWLDRIAQDGFVSQWEMIDRRYKGVSSEWLSFDLVNEPPAIGDFDFTRDRHEALIRRTVSAIRAVDPDRAIVIDGLDGGNLAMPELADLGLTHSGRGYQPMTVSHYGANWWAPSSKFPLPTYPGCEWDGKIWDRDAIDEWYAPWRAVERLGTKIHIGEFGCHNKTSNEVALKWFEDLFGLFCQYGWGYALWGFEGAFGIIGHDRPGTVYEQRDGYQVDRQLLDLMLQSRA